MKTILRTDRAEIYEINGEFYVYTAVTDRGLVENLLSMARDPIVCPSEAMARSIAAGA